MPFILLTLEEGEIIKDYWRNNRKHQRLKERTESIFGFDDETEIKHAEVRSNNDPIEEIIRNEDRRNVNRALALLSQKQRTRVIKHFYDNKSLGEIAGEEGVNKNAVAKSVEQALKIMKNFFENAADGYALLSRQRSDGRQSGQKNGVLCGRLRRLLRAHSHHHMVPV